MNYQLRYFRVTSVILLTTDLNPLKLVSFSLCLVVGFFFNNSICVCQKIYFAKRNLEIKWLSCFFFSRTDQYFWMKFFVVHSKKMKSNMPQKEYFNLKNWCCLMTNRKYWSIYRLFLCKELSFGYKYSLFRKLLEELGSVKQCDSLSYFRWKETWMR